DMIKKMCEWLVTNNMDDCPLHFSRFHPMWKLTQLPSTPVSTLEKAHAIAVDTGIKYVFVGNVPGHSTENTYCHNCKEIVIRRRGYTILDNYILDNKCSYCGTVIPGVWEE
ncbi:radical SAM protein, partial [Bacteroidota bacterium]